MLAVPILHVNGEDPAAVAAAVELAVAWRQRYHRDVVIDMYCYRKHGHNEGDEPSFTQPLMYEQIRRGPRPARSTRSTSADASATPASPRSATDLAEQPFAISIAAAEGAAIDAASGGSPDKAGGGDLAFYRPPRRPAPRLWARSHR
jgi:2-oxoglutarate dehydrogenase E1 component